MASIDMRTALASFAGRRVFVTGHTGFKGSWLSFLLVRLGAKVTGFALPPAYTPSHFELLGVQKSIDHIVGDIRDADSLQAAMQRAEPEFVIHLAAQALVKTSYAEPVVTFQTNVLGTVNVLEAVRRCPSVRSLVCITSDKCYENVEWLWGYRETDTLGGRDPYSASKAAAEIAFSAYARSYFETRPELGAATTRAGNVIGGGDWAADRIVPDCVRAVTSGKPIVLRNPGSTRPWQHVLEPLSGYLLLAAALRLRPAEFAGAWNFGPDTRQVRTVRELAIILARELGGQTDIETTSVRTLEHEAVLLQLNCDRAHLKLGWSPRWGVDRTLSATAEWYRAVLAGKSAAQVTGAQIEEYFSELADLNRACA